MATQEQIDAVLAYLDPEEGESDERYISVENLKDALTALIALIPS